MTILERRPGHPGQAMAKIDIAYTADFEQLCDLLYEHNCTMEILAPRGPAGGNPYVAFYGPKDDLRTFLGKFK